MNILAKLRGASPNSESDSGARGASHVIFGQIIQFACNENGLDTAHQLRDLRTIYEPFLASRAIPKAGVCLDLGAGAGWFGLPFAMAFKDWTVICVEADPVQYDFLKINVERLQLENVVCINAAFHPEVMAEEGDDASAFLRGEVRGRPANFQHLRALSMKLAPVITDSVPVEDVVSCSALSPDLIADLSPDLIRLDAPGCEAAIAQALKHKSAGLVVGRTYPYLPSHSFAPSEWGGARQFYLVHGDHILRRDYEDDFPTRKSRLDVVVAMFNARDFIRECVDSILADGNPDIRVLVVDDGSTDGSGKMVDSLYGDNPRVRLLSKTNGGCASARNFGRRHSDASHIAFIDADDRLDPGMFSALLETARYTGTFVAEGEFKTFTTGPDGVDIFSPSHEAEVYKNAGHHRLADFDFDWIPGAQIIIGQPTIWRRVYRRDFLDRKKIWFPEHVRAFDDQIFQLYVGHYAGSIAHVREQFYHYRQHPAQDIKQGDERHFYSFNMFRSVFLRALDEGWQDISLIIQSLLNTMSWSYGGLRDDLKQIYVEAAVEFLAILDRTFGGIEPDLLRTVGIPGLDYLVQRQIREMGNAPVNYAMMRLESWRWQPEFIRMMLNIK